MCSVKWLRRLMLIVVMTDDPMPDLFGALETQIAAAENKQWCDDPWRESLEKQQRRQQDDEFAEERPGGDLADHGQLAGGCDTGDVFRRHGRIVHDNACGLARSFRRVRGNVIDLRRSHLGDGGDVVEQCEKAAHRFYCVLCFICPVPAF